MLIEVIYQLSHSTYHFNALGLGILRWATERIAMIAYTELYSAQIMISALLI